MIIMGLPSKKPTNHFGKPPKHVLERFAPTKAEMAKAGQKIESKVAIKIKELLAEGTVASRKTAHKELVEQRLRTRFQIGFPEAMMLRELLAANVIPANLKELIESVALDSKSKKPSATQIAQIKKFLKDKPFL